MATRAKAAGYHGVQNMKFALKTADTYAASSTEMKYAQALSLTAQLSPIEQYADNRLLFRLPGDTGYDGSIGTTAPDSAFEKLAGFAMDGESGLLRTRLAVYARGALYYEYIENAESGAATVIKAWLLNVEVGKGDESYATDKNSAEFGTFAYPIRVIGDPVKAASGSADYLDANGLGRFCCMVTCGPTDTGYSTFGDTVPVPKVAAGE